MIRSHSVRWSGPETPVSVAVAERRHQQSPHLALLECLEVRVLERRGAAHRGEGRAAELVSVLGNRPAMLTALSGDGVDLLAARVSSRRIRTAG